MATVIFTNAEMVAMSASSSAVGSDWETIVAPAWFATSNINGASGVVVFSAPASPTRLALLQVFRLLVDDASVPPVITMTNLNMQFDYSITCPGGNSEITVGGVSAVPIVAAGSGHFDQNNDPTAYWGGTDRATLFGSVALWEFASTSTSAQQSVTITSFTLTVTYTTPSTPAVTSVTPSSGSVSGGQAVTIHGEGFTGAPGAKFGGIAVTSFVVVDDFTATAVTPAHASGLVDVEVLGVATGTDLYTYVLDRIRLPPMPTRTPMTQGGGKRRGR